MNVHGALRVGAGAWLLASLGVAASDEPPPVIESIEIRVNDVFESEEGSPDSWPYRLANQLHIETREGVIRRELLFAEGDVVDPEALAQTERNLRALPFLREARVETAESRQGDGKVRVRVVASDSWSTAPETRLSKVGNKWLWGVGATEHNLFGRGKQVEALHTSGLDRDETSVVYRDPRLVGTRVSLATRFSAASDGHHASLGAQRPFYSLATLWSVSGGLEDFDRLDPLYEDGERIVELRHQRSRGNIDVARALRRTGRSALRLHFGYELSDDLVGTDRRKFGVLRAGFTSVEHDYRELTHVNRFERTEDVNLGSEVSAFLGVSSPALGGEPGSALFFLLSGRRGVPLNAEGFLLAAATWQARRRGGEIENSVARFRIDFVQKVSARRVVLAKADYHHGSRLDPEVQIRLGAESGLRGYRVRQFNGDRSLLLSAEGRWFVADDVAQLVSVGFACFADSGFAWPAGSPISLGDLRSNVGVSLLLGANRVSASRPGVRFDFAYALTPSAGRSPWLISAGSQLGF